jgi:hypothetical protein
MLIKAVILFLLVMVAIGMVGNALFPGSISKAAKKRLPLAQNKICPKCGKYQIGKSECGCRSK